MTISRSNTNHRQRGISLVEILVVLSIVAMVAGVVVINAPPPRSDLRDTADQFAARLEAAAQFAITSGAVIGIVVDAEEYTFYRYNRGDWNRIDEKSFSHEKFAADYAVNIELKEAAKKNERDDAQQSSETVIRPQILFAPTGETSAFSVGFQSRRESIRLTMDEAGGVKVEHDAGA